MRVFHFSLGLNLSNLISYKARRLALCEKGRDFDEVGLEKNEMEKTSSFYLPTVFTLGIYMPTY